MTGVLGYFVTRCAQLPPAALFRCAEEQSYLASGTGDILEPMNGVIGIGSGGIYAQTAATALIDVDGLTAEEIAKKSMKVRPDRSHGPLPPALSCARWDAEPCTVRADCKRYVHLHQPQLRDGDHRHR